MHETARIMLMADCKHLFCTGYVVNVLVNFYVPPYVPLLDKICVTKFYGIHGHLCLIGELHKFNIMILFIVGFCFS
jgi:hypothetical protein